MKKRTLALFSVLLALTMLGGCGGSAPVSPATSPASAAAPPASSGSSAAAPAAEPEFDGETVIALVAPVSGNNKMVGQYQQQGFNLAMEEINSAGGVLGKKIVPFLVDEIDTMQASVNAYAKIFANPDVSAIVGSSYSVNCIAILPQLEDAKIPHVSLGSAVALRDKNCPWNWMLRPIDPFQYEVLAQTAVQDLKVVKPAILYSDDAPRLTGLQYLIGALQKYGVDVPKDMQFATPNDEKNYGPILTQIQNSGADCLICLSDQMPAVLIAQQVSIAGFDIPLIGSTSYCSSVFRQNAGDVANGWYASSDWSVEANTPSGAAFEKKFREAYGMPSDLAAVSAYDGVYAIKHAMEIAGTTADRAAINEAFKQFKDFVGAMSTYTYFEGDSCLNTSLFATHNENGLPVVIKNIKVR